MTGKGVVGMNNSPSMKKEEVLRKKMNI